MMLIPCSQLTLTTLRFFETLFKRSNQHAVTNLVLRNFPPHALETTDRDLVAVRADVDMWQGLEPPACQAGDSPTDTDYYAYFMDAQREVRVRRAIGRSVRSCSNAAGK
jgi:hypothetical protein